MEKMNEKYEINLIGNRYRNKLDKSRKKDINRKNRKCKHLSFFLKIYDI